MAPGWGFSVPRPCRAGCSAQLGTEVLGWRLEDPGLVPGSSPMQPGHAGHAPTMVLWLVTSLLRLPDLLGPGEQGQMESWKQWCAGNYLTTGCLGGGGTLDLLHLSVSVVSVFPPQVSSG